LTRFCAHAKVKITGSIDRDLFSADGGRLKGKTPDQGFQVIIPGLEPRHYPNIIVEVGYSESHSDLIENACGWLTEACDDPVLCALIIIFRKPMLSFNFTDSSKWKASLEVYEQYIDQFLTILILSDSPKGTRKTISPDQKRMRGRCE